MNRAPAALPDFSKKQKKKNRKKEEEEEEEEENISNKYPEIMFWLGHNEVRNKGRKEALPAGHAAPSKMAASGNGCCDVSDTRRHDSILCKDAVKPAAVNWQLQSTKYATIHRWEMPRWIR